MKGTKILDRGKKSGFNIITNQAKNLKSYLLAVNALSKSVNGFLFQ